MHHRYSNISYNVECNGIEAGEYYFRLVIEVTGEAQYFLANVQNNAELLQKKHYNKINYTGTVAPETCDLSQNYPNPFNPTTTIGLVYKVNQM